MNNCLKKCYVLLTFAAGGFSIANKSISRKHLVIEVGELRAGDSARLESKSELALEDLKTKLGTTVNGISINGQRRSFNDVYNEVKLGHFDQVFKIRWIPVVLSFSFTGKELRSNEIAKFSEKVEDLDIKVLTDYVPGSTTHVVAKKRNTSKGLQALINGKHIVDHSFVDAIVATTQPEEDGTSPLEKDWDASWPSETEHLPPRGLEQTERPSEAYAPDSARQEIFDGYTFIFYDQAQFDNLLAPITQGKGKALLHPVEPNATTPDDFVRYVKGVAGEKGLGEFEDGSEGKGVVVVKYQPLKGDTLPFYQDFGRRVALQLDHRLIEQSEFLDAILNNNASVLRRPLEIDSSSTAGPAPTPIDKSPNQEYRDRPPSSSTVQEEAPMPPPAARRLGRTRRTVTSRFKGFDDEFADKKEDDKPESMLGIVAAPESQLFISQSEAGSAPAQHESLSERRRKRQREEEQIQQENEAELDELAPAATRLKRLRLENEEKARQEGRELPQQPIPKPTPEIVAPPKKKSTRKEIDILEVTKKQREEQDARAKEERQALEEAMEGIDSAAVRRLIPTETMTVKSVVPNAQRWNQDQNSRWHEEWNGRPNFKKFRRKGQGSPLLMQKVIVPLQVANKNDYGVGDIYWLQGESESQMKANERNAVAKMDSFIGEPDAPSQARRKGEEGDQEMVPDSAPERVQIEIEDSDDEDTPPVILKARRRRAARASPAPRRPEPVMTGPRSSLASVPSRSNKRQATEGRVRDGPAKRAKSSVVPVEEDEEKSDEGGLGFKFKKRR